MMDNEDEFGEIWEPDLEWSYIDSRPPQGKPFPMWLLVALCAIAIVLILCAI